VASRLEGFDKSPVGPEELLRIHLSDATGSLLDGRFATVGIGDVMLKGKDVPVHVHRLSGTVDAAPPAGKGEGR
jgi:class 3 adenylate cyclase